MGRGKRQYKEYNCKELWEELEVLFQAHASVSSKHEELFKILHRIKNKEEVNLNNTSFENSRKRKKLADNPIVHIGVDESPESPPSSPLQKMPKTENNAVTNTKSILQIMREKQELQALHLHVEFHGRLVDPVRCQLYPNIDQEKPVKSDERNGSNRHGGRASSGGQQNRNNSHKNRFNGNRNNHQHRNIHSSNQRQNEVVNNNASAHQSGRKSTISFTMPPKKNPLLNKHSAMHQD